MNDETKVDALKSLSDVYRSQFNLRRGYEWNVLLLTLGIYASVLASKYTNSVTFPTTCTFRVSFCVMTFLLATISSIYLWFIHRTNKINQDFAHAAENALIALSGVNEFDNIKENMPKFVGKYWSYAFQVSTIVLFGIATIYIVLYL